MERQLEIFDIGVGFKSSGVNGQIKRFIFWRNVRLDHETIKTICSFLHVLLGVEVLVGPALDEGAASAKQIQPISDYSGDGLYVEEDWAQKIRAEFADLWGEIERGMTFKLEFGGNTITISVKREPTT